ncbi:hypothetical protein [Niastella populi]|nr:hypothetical protein [Niastella populi]
MPTHANGEEIPYYHIDDFYGNNISARTTFLKQLTGYVSDGWLYPVT